MPYIAGSVVLVASTRSTNQAVGTLEEFITRPSIVRLAAVTSTSPCLVKLVVGRTVLSDDQNVTSVGTSINIPDHVIVEHAALRGRLSLSFLSTGTPTVLWRVDVIPMR